MNTYTFTKWMTEEVLSEFHGRAFPIAIVRPSIVVRLPTRLLPAVMKARELVVT